MREVVYAILNVNDIEASDLAPVSTSIPKIMILGIDVKANMISSPTGHVMTL